MQKFFALLLICAAAEVAQSALPEMDHKEEKRIQRSPRRTQRTRNSTSKYSKPMPVKRSIVDKITARGTSECQNLCAKNLNLSGICALRNVDVGEAKLSGKATVKDSTLSSLTLSTYFTSLENCTVDTIVVNPPKRKKWDEAPREPVLELRNTRVKNEITFTTEKPGRVGVDGTCNIEKVVNADLYEL